MKRIAQLAREPLIVCVLGLPATWPLWKSTLPRSFDGLFHLYRLLQLNHLLRQGVVYSAWAPDLLYGYGYPIFSFVPPLPYYISEVLLLGGLTLVQTVLFSFTLTLLASGVAMYFFVRDVFGPKAGLVAAVAYMYAPFHLSDILYRGNLPGSWSAVLYPLVLYTFRRLAYKGGLSYFIASALSYAACFLTHNPANLIFQPFLLLYLAVLILVRKRDRPAAIATVAAAMVLGAGLASFFWIPALSDRQWVQVERLITPPDLDYHSHFIPLTELLAPSPSADTGLMNPGVTNNIGPVFVLLSIVSALNTWRFRRTDELTHLGVSMLGLAIVVFMVLPHSAAVWESLPLIRYLEYPHRFLRLGSLLVAILCGASVRVFPDNARRWSASFVVTLTSVAMIIASTYSLLYPPYYRDIPSNPSFVDMMDFERRTGTVGTTSFGEFLPLWVEWMPTGSPLEPMYRSSASIERLDMAALPDRTRIIEASYAPHSMLIHLDAPRSFQATFNCLYFPGWRAYVDGHKTNITPTPGLGLISVSIPSGEHLVQLRFEDMPVHVLSKLISGLSVALLVLLSAGLGFLPQRLGAVGAIFRRTQTPDDRYRYVAQMDNREASALAVLVMVLLGVKIGCLDGHNTWFKRDFAGSQVEGVKRPLSVEFGDQITLLGYDLSSSVPVSGDTLVLDLYWKSQRKLKTDYSSFAHLVDDEMNIYAQKDSLNPGRYPTRYWEPDEYNNDPHEMVIPPGTPPGDYVLGVGVYDSSTLIRLPVPEDEGSRDGMLFLQDITVLKSDQPPDVDELGIQNDVMVHFSNGMTLLGYSLERPYLAPGDFNRLALFWRASERPDDQYTVGLRLVDQHGDAALCQLTEPSAGRYPTTQWEEGEIVRDNHSLWIGADWAAGDYLLQLAVMTPQGREVPVDAVPGHGVDKGWLQLQTMSTGD